LDPFQTTVDLLLQMGKADVQRKHAKFNAQVENKYDDGHSAHN